MTLPNALTWFIGIVGLIWYFVCLIVVGGQFCTDPSRAGFRDFMSLSLTTIGVALATFVGVLLGFRVVSNEVRGVSNQVQSAENQPAQLALGVTKLNSIVTNTAGSGVQWSVAILYVASLLLAICFWWWKGDGSDPAIINLAKSLLGLVGGALSVLLNIPRS